MIDPAVSRRHVRAITESLSPLEVPDKMTVLLRTLALMAIASGHPREIERQLIDALAARLKETHTEARTTLERKGILPKESIRDEAIALLERMRTAKKGRRERRRQ
jgi:hypothetical protein